MFIVLLLALTIFTLNFSAAQDVDDSTNVEVSSTLDNQSNQTVLKLSSLIKTEIDIESKPTFNVIGGNFKIKLVDENKTVIANENVTFDLEGNTYQKTTDEGGIASLKLILDDGSYNITTIFSGNSIYGASSKTTSFTINNTRVVDEGLSNSEIQDIIDNARANNVILFRGDNYENINLIINKSLTLISNSNTLLQSNSSGPVIKIQGRNASLTKLIGFTIKGADDGILVNNSDYVTILNNEITANGGGIIAENTNYLNITKNSIVKNGKYGVVILNDNNTYITDNDISNNGHTGILISKSNNTYIYSNSIMSNKYYGISAVKEINGVNYGEGPENLQIVTNNISRNGDAGIDLYHVNDNLKVTGNTISSNRYAISLNNVSSNLIQSNVISNHRIAIQFSDDYVRPGNQEISYNAFILNTKDLEARDTAYDEYNNQLQLEDNWHTDYGFVCPKVKAGKIKFTVTHLGGDYFQATFLDSNGNVASLLPDRTLTYNTDDGQVVSFTVSGGISVFKVTDVTADIFKATIDKSPRTADYDRDSSADLSEYSGESPQYSYPSISGYGLYEDFGGAGEGEYIGEGDYGDATKGNGDFSGENSEFTGNGTTTQKADPSSSANSQVNDVSQSSESQASSQESASKSSGDYSSGATSGEKSVVKQIIIDDEDIFRVTGMSFIVLLIALTIGYYYKDDIKEMKNKL